MICPAGESCFPVMAPAPSVECRIAGRLQLKEGSKCCSNYTTCRIWTQHKDNYERARSGREANELQNVRAKHTLDGAERDTIRA